MVFFGGRGEEAGLGNAFFFTFRMGIIYLGGNRLATRRPLLNPSLVHLPRVNFGATQVAKPTGWGRIIRTVRKSRWQWLMSECFYIKSQQAFFPPVLTVQDNGPSLTQSLCHGGLQSCVTNKMAEEDWY